MRSFRVTQENHDVNVVQATHYQSAGQGAVTFYRRHPSSPEEGTPYNPDAPYFEPLQVAMFTQVISVILIEEE